MSNSQYDHFPSYYVNSCWMFPVVSWYASTMPDCRLCNQVSITPSHNNYRECNHCFKYFLCLTVAQEHISQCKKNHSDSLTSGSKRSRSPHIQSCEKRANSASGHCESSPSVSRAHQDQDGGSRAHPGQDGGSSTHQDDEERSNTFTPFQKKRTRVCFKELQRYFDYEYTSNTADMIHFLNDTRLECS